MKMLLESPSRTFDAIHVKSLNKTFALKKGEATLAEVHFIAYLEDLGPYAEVNSEEALDIPEIKINYPKPSVILLFRQILRRCSSSWSIKCYGSWNNGKPKRRKGLSKGRRRSRKPFYNPFPNP